LNHHSSGTAVSAEVMSFVVTVRVQPAATIALDAAAMNM
jgi:hypothetical protein